MSRKVPTPAEMLMALENNGGGGGGSMDINAAARKPRKTEAQRLAEEAARIAPSGSRNAKKQAAAAKAAAAAAEAAERKAASANFRRLTTGFGGVGLLNDNPARGAGGAAAAAPQKASPYLLQLKRQYNSARKALEDITQNNRKEGEKGEYVTQSAIGLRARQEAEDNFLAAQAAFEEAYSAEGNPSLEGGRRRRRAKKTKRRAHTKRRQTKRR
jgi:hypothetical protein